MKCCAARLIPQPLRMWGLPWACSRGRGCDVQHGSIVIKFEAPLSTWGRAHGGADRPVSKRLARHTYPQPKPVYREACVDLRTLKFRYRSVCPPFVVPAVKSDDRCLDRRTRRCATPIGTNAEVGFFVPFYASAK